MNGHLFNYRNPLQTGVFVPTIQTVECNIQRQDAMIEYDFDDPHIRDMVMFDHAPEELWIHNVGGSFLDRIQCEKCHGSWPCTPALDLKQWLKNKDVSR